MTPFRNNRIYKNAQLFLVTSELMEKHFMEQCGIDEELLDKAEEFLDDEEKKNRN